MPDNARLLQFYDRWIDEIGRCLTSPMSMPACKPFWEYVMYTSAATGLALMLWAAWKLVDYLMQFMATRRAQREHERVASKATMRKYTWNDDKHITDNMTDPHLAEKIRIELQQRRLKNLQSSSR